MKTSKLRARKIVRIVISTGERSLVDTPTISLNKYLHVIDRLNMDADVYGVAYHSIDQEANDFFGQGELDD